MEETPIGRIAEHFGKVRDPRIGNATRHKLLDIIVIAICAIICGADGWNDVADFIMGLKHNNLPKDCPYENAACPAVLRMFSSVSHSRLSLYFSNLKSKYSGEG